MAERESQKITVCCGGKDNRNCKTFVTANNSVVVEEANSLAHSYYSAGAVKAATAERAALQTEKI